MGFKWFMIGIVCGFALGILTSVVITMYRVYIKPKPKEEDDRELIDARRRAIINAKK